MNQPFRGIRYLGIADVFVQYARVFHCMEEQALDQVRSLAVLESALSRPQSRSLYQDADLALQAAVLAHGIAEDQAFVEGNKRTALAATLTILLVNGYEISASQQERFDWMRRLSEGETVEQLAGRIRAALVPVGED
jgi:death-on-curing protein